MPIARKAAPSFKEEAFPAVTVPFFLNTAFNCPSLLKLCHFEPDLLNQI
jgi:hypothetical protein